MRVIEVSAEENLAPFSQFLWQHRVAHRIFEERGLQVLELAESAHAAEVQKAYSAWCDGSLKLNTVALPGSGFPGAASRIKVNRIWLWATRWDR